MPEEIIVFEELKKDISVAEDRINSIIMELVTKYGRYVDITPSFSTRKYVSFQEILNGSTEYESKIEVTLKKF